MTTEITTATGQIESTKDSLVKDLKGIAGKADRLLKDAGQSVAEELSTTRRAISEKARGVANVTNDYAHANPWKIAGVAVAVGAFVGVLIRRR